MILDRFRVGGRVAVVLSARSGDQLEKVATRIDEPGCRAVVVPADLRDLDAVAALADTAQERLGRLDIVVNNVGGTIPNALLDTDPGYLEEAFHFNVSTAHALVRSAVPHMLRHDGGAVVNVGSIMGRVGGRGYLASPAGGYVTGKVLEVDGGLEQPILDLRLPDLELDR